jgi:RNA polymerase sigma-70 factor (ECF subfamily)
MQAEWLDQVPDDVLVERHKATMDPAFFAEIFLRHRKVVYRCCLAMMRDREIAADLTQDSFIKALERIQGYHGGQLRAWLLRIARHHCIDEIRRYNRSPRTLEDMERQGEAEGIADDLVGKLTLRALLASLTDEQQLCLKLFYFNGLRYQEIARLTNFEEKAVKSHIQNGLRRMRVAHAD